MTSIIAMTWIIAMTCIITVTWINAMYILTLFIGQYGCLTYLQDYHEQHYGDWVA